MRQKGETLLVLTSDFPPDSGGLSEYTAAVSKNLSQFFAKAIVLVERRESIQKPSGQDYPFRWQEVYTGQVGFAVRFCKLFSASRRILRTETVDKVLAITWSPCGAVVWALSFGFNFQYYLAAHGLEILEPQRSLKYRCLMKQVFNRARKTFPVSRFTQNELFKIGVPRSRVVVVPCGADPEKFEGPLGDSPLPERSEREEKIVLLTVGRLVRRKGHDLVIRALKRLKNRSADLFYVIVGSGPERANLERLVREYDLQDRVSFAGFVPDEDLAGFYRACDIFVMPVRSFPEEGDVEGFGIVFLEANLCAKPVIAARCGGVEDAVIDETTGLLVEPDNEEALSEAILRLSESAELREKLGEQGKNRVRSSLNWSETARRLAEEMGVRKKGQSPFSPFSP